MGVVMLLIVLLMKSRDRVCGEGVACRGGACDCVVWHVLGLLWVDRVEGRGGVVGKVVKMVYEKGGSRGGGGKVVGVEGWMWRGREEEEEVVWMLLSVLGRF